MQNFSSKLVENSSDVFVEFTAKISDKDLLKLCKRYGTNALLWRRRFAGLLPEVEKRRLFEKKGCSSVFMFAAKLAGMRKSHVQRVLNVAKKFEALPILKAMLENGEVSINKLARIASVVTSANEEFWAAQAKLLSKSALETLVRDEKYLREASEDGLAIGGGQNKSAQGLGSSRKVDKNTQSGVYVFQGQNGLFKPQSDTESVPRHASGGIEFSQLVATQKFAQQELNISAEVKEKLLKLQRRGIDINELLTEFIEKRDQEIAQEKEKLAANTKSTNSHHLPAKIQKLIDKEFGIKCSIDWCMREAVEIHHLQRFSLAQKHDPRYLAPCCKEHHAIAHSIDLKFHEARAKSKSA